MKKNRKSTIKLPSLRPATPGTARKERNVFGLTGTNSRPNTDYEVNRTIFQDMKPSDPSEIKKKRKAKPKTLDPIDQSKEIKPSQEPQPAQNSEISQIEALMSRIPTAETEVSVDVVYKITPVLDRVLCIVNSFSCIDHIDDPVISELFKRLFALIDVDDFLTRIIICRILLMFVSDETSSLILPISKIFYKLSCDPSNDDYFVEENLETVLVSILRMKNMKASLMAAGSIRNLAVYEPMREKLCEKDDLFNFIFDTFNCPNLGSQNIESAKLEEIIDDKVIENNDKKNHLNSEKNVEMKKQLIGIVRKMIKSVNFKSKVLESNFLSLAYADKCASFEVLKTLKKIDDLTDEGKSDFIEWFLETEFSDNNLELIIGCLPNVTKGLEQTSQCCNLLIKLIKAVGNDQEKLTQILKVLNISCENHENLKLCQNLHSLFTDLVQSTELDTNIRIEAYKIVKKFPQDQFGAIQKEFLFLNALIRH